MYLRWCLIFWACGIWRRMSKSSFFNPRNVGGKSGVMLTDSWCVFTFFVFESHLFRAWRSLNRIMKPLLAWRLSLWHDEKSVVATSVMPRCCCVKLTHAALVSSSSSSSSPFRPCTVSDHLRRCTSRSRVWRVPLPHHECAVQWLVWYGDRNHPYVDLCEIWPSQQHLWWPWTRTMISFRPRYFQGGCWDHWAHPLYWTEPPPGLTGGVPPRWGQLLPWFNLDNDSDNYLSPCLSVECNYSSMPNFNGGLRHGWRNPMFYTNWLVIHVVIQMLV